MSKIEGGSIEFCDYLECLELISPMQDSLHVKSCNAWTGPTEDLHVDLHIPWHTLQA